MARGAKNHDQPGVTLPFEPAVLCRRLLAWYGREGRELPWRGTRDPYRVWLSEIMLQQTTVAAVIPYYERFLMRFPTVEALAAAPLDEVIALWAGLGYYSRARNLHDTARRVVAAGGRFPDTLAGLAELPGVGRSTAGAILSIAFDRPAPILDGNVRRVLVRLFAWTDDPRSSAAEQQLWAWAERLTPAERPHDYAQAIMDLGATVCTPRAPDCDSCPLGELCLARRDGLAEALPAKRRRAAVPLRCQAALVVTGDGGVLLRQRPAQGFLGGLWEFPVADLADGQPAESAAAALRDDLGLSGALEPAGELRHAYSHFRLQLTLFRLEAEAAGAIAEESGWRWCLAEELDTLPLHGAHRKAWIALAADG